MKKTYIIIIVLLIVLPAVLIPLVMKNQQSEDINDKYDNENNTDFEHYERPEHPFIVKDSAIVKVLDIKGAELNLYSFKSECKEMYNGSLNYQGKWLSGIFEEQKVLPVRKSSGLIALYYIKEIDEYYFDGKNVTILLSNGKIVKGYPVNDYSVSGLSSFGDISIPMENIHFAKFNTIITEKEVEKSKKRLKQYINSPYKSSITYHYWPDDFDETIEITTKSNHSEIINSPVFIYNLSGCDESWIPCKSYTVWKLAGFIPVKNGTFNVNIDIKDIKSLELKINKEKNDAEYLIDLELKNGEKMTNALLYNGKNGFEKEYCTNVGILGITEEGISFLSINNMKKISNE